MDDLVISFIDRDKMNSRYDWANIKWGSKQVGKARCHIQNDTIIIYSIFIFPHYQGKGMGSRVINKLKMEYHSVYADRVRPEAREFWQKMGFWKSDHDSYVCHGR